MRKTIIVLLTLASVTVGSAKTFEVALFSGLGRVGIGDDPADHVPLGIQASIGLPPGSSLFLGLDGEYHGIGDKHITQSMVGVFVRLETGEHYPRFYLRGGVGSYMGEHVSEVMETDEHGNELGMWEFHNDYDPAFGGNLGVGWIMGVDRRSKRFISWEFIYHRIFNRKLSGSNDGGDVNSWTLRLLFGLRFQDV